MIRTGLRALFLLALFRPSHGQNCPILGSAYPPVADSSSSPALNAAKVSFRDALTELLASGQIGNSTAFSLQVFGRDDSGDDPIFEYYHTGLATSSAGNGSISEIRSRNATVGPRTLYRIGSISKLISVYAILAKLGGGYWNEPVTKYVSELADAADQGESDAVDHVQWSEVTLGALASHMSGIGRDYSLGDFSALPISIPGLPAPNETEIVRCGAGVGGLGPCTRAESMKMILKKQPVFPAYHSPNYSNMAFQLLAYAIENITGQAFATVVEEMLVKPLGLSRTFLSVPLNDTDAAVVDGWAEDLGDAGPAGGYVQSVADLSRIGQSILASSLLSGRATREWLKPVSHTSSAVVSVGRPWEIVRVPVPVSNPPTNATTGTTRLADVYTKNGGLGQYASILGLSPDHGIGISILVAGPEAGAVLGALQGLVIDTWVRAGEEAAREQARFRFAGLYTSSPGGDNSSAEITLLPDEPAIFLASLVSNGTDMLQAIEGVVGGGEPGERFGAWLYPTTLGSSNGSRVAFRAVFGAVGRKAEEICLSWGGVDGLRYGGQPADLLVFEFGEDDDNDDRRAVAVEIPVLKRVLWKRD